MGAGRNIGNRPVAGDNLARAVGMIVLAGLSFSMVGVAVRMSGDVPVYEKVFFRSIVSLVVMGAFAFRGAEKPFARDGQTKMLLLRGAFGTTAMTLYFFAISRLTLADATILNKLSPFFVAVFAVAFLRERLSRHTIPALVVAFLGAGLVIKPQLDIGATAAIAGLLSAAGSGAAYTVVRFLRGKVSPYRVVFFFALVSTVAMVPPMVFRYVAPSGRQLLFMLGAGVFATTGQLFLTLAYHQAPATKISIYNYAHVVFAFLLGLAIWGEVPDALSIVGTVLIVAAAVYNHVKVISVRAVPPPS
ncbi:MAG: EamA family transporter [Candidatus Eisenbacteria bacterium]|nr:EamA family transporter [Candidatus Eisenbacteria bacterium]